MGDPTPQESADAIVRARDSISRAIDFLAGEKVFEAILELEKARSLLHSRFPDFSPQKAEPVHDWMVVDPYTAQCRICGKQRPLGTQERILSPLSL